MLEPAIYGLYFIGLGLTFALDFRGFVTRSADRETRSMEDSAAAKVFRRMPPWRSWFAKPIEARVRRQVRLFRVIGIAFTVVGLHFFGVAFGLFN